MDTPEVLVVAEAVGTIPKVGRTRVLLVVAMLLVPCSYTTSSRCVLSDPHFSQFIVFSLERHYFANIGVLSQAVDRVFSCHDLLLCEFVPSQSQLESWFASSCAHRHRVRFHFVFKLKTQLAPWHWVMACHGSCVSLPSMSIDLGEIVPLGVLGNRFA